MPLIKPLSQTLKQDKEKFKVPKSVQQAIPIRKIWPDGIFQVESKYSRTFRFTDINYSIASKADKTEMFLDYSELLNALDSGCTAKITLNNRKINKEEFEQSLLIPMKGDGLDEYRKEYNDMLLSKISELGIPKDKIRVGLEATGHYSSNLAHFISEHDLPLLTFNPLLTNRYKQGFSLRKTKTDKVDACAIAQMIVSGKGSQTYSSSLYHNEEMKSLSRYRSQTMQKCSKLKISVSRLVTILFPELEGLTSSIHLASIYALLKAYPGHEQIAHCSMKRLTRLLSDASQGRFDKSKALEIHQAACRSIGKVSLSASMELVHTITDIEVLKQHIVEIDEKLKEMVDQEESSIIDIPGIGYTLCASILGEVGDFKRFPDVDKLLAYAGMSPSKHDSGDYHSKHNKMEKRGSPYLRKTLYLAARLVAQNVPRFKEYLEKKLSEHKPYKIALSHVAKKLIRLIYRLGISGCPYLA